MLQLSLADQAGNSRAATGLSETLRDAEHEKTSPHQTGTARGATPTQILQEQNCPGLTSSTQPVQKHTPRLSVCVLGSQLHRYVSAHAVGSTKKRGQAESSTDIRHMWGSTAVLSQAQNTTAQAMGADAPANFPMPGLCSFFPKHNLFSYSSAQRSLSCSRNHKLLLVRAEREVHCGKRSKSLTSVVRDFSSAPAATEIIHPTQKTL